jgi:cell division protein FtsQ
MIGRRRAVAEPEQAESDWIDDDWPEPRPPRRRDPWRVAFFSVLALAVAGGGAWVLLGSSLLGVSHVRVTGNRLVTAGQVVAAADVRRGTPLASVDTGAIARRVDRITQVLSATVTRSWPDTIVITVRERTPALAIASGRQFALIDPFGVIVRWSRLKPAQLPLLTSPPAVLRGNPGIRVAAAVLRQLPRPYRGMVTSVSAAPAEGVTLSLRGRITVVWGGAGRAAAKAAELAVLLRTGAHYVDVSDPATAVTQG